MAIITPEAEVEVQAEASLPVKVTAPKARAR